MKSADKERGPGVSRGLELSRKKKEQGFPRSFLCACFTAELLYRSDASARNEILSEGDKWQPHKRT
jgi:hypothetical protein